MEMFFGFVIAFYLDKWSDEVSLEWSIILGILSIIVLIGGIVSFLFFPIFK